MTEKKSITKEIIAEYPVEEFSGRIIVARTESEVIKAMSYLSSFPIIGFDTETRPSYKKGTIRGVALMQLSTDDTCFLIRLNLTDFPPCLVDFLSNAKIQKVGLSLRDDFLSMNRRTKIEPKGFIDLQKIVPRYGFADIGLQKIYAILFGKRISKGQRLTNWEAGILTDAQKKYAALDAWACLKIYKKLISIYGIDAISSA
ncbi:MAG: 3'-5' exonuclease domain-containing protein 2 [Dysgonamonadaceae bacterium]|nr:3'-5' exonuclease domain-containing protein 2 [Dysgonamonadaceae bacterium]